MTPVPAGALFFLWTTPSDYNNQKASVEVKTANKLMSYRIARSGRVPDLPGQRDHLYAAPVFRTGHASLTNPGESASGGRVVMGAGYKDGRQGLDIRNLWGERWGRKGYFTQPYAYVTDENLATDFWTIRIVQ
jgi:hypothetical protein